MPQVSAVLFASPFPGFGFSVCDREHCIEATTRLANLTVVPFAEVAESYPSLLGRVSNGNVLRILPYDAYSTSMGIDMQAICMDLVTLEVKVVPLNKLVRFEPPLFRVSRGLHHTHECDFCGQDNGPRRAVMKVKGCASAGMVSCGTCLKKGCLVGSRLTHSILAPEIRSRTVEGGKWTPVGGCVAVKIAGLGWVAEFFLDDGSKKLKIECMELHEVSQETAPPKEPTIACEVEAEQAPDPARDDAFWENLFKDSP